MVRILRKLEMKPADSGRLDRGHVVVFLKLFDRYKTELSVIFLLVLP